MKKIYIAPKAEMTEMEMESMIAVSPQKVYNTTLDPNEAEGRAFDLDWDDEEEDF